VQRAEVEMRVRVTPLGARLEGGSLRTSTRAEIERYSTSRLDAHTDERRRRRRRSFNAGRVLVLNTPPASKASRAAV